jgi:hypothetical protein
MSGRNAKLFRKMFPDNRLAYKAFKESYAEASIDKRIEVRKLALKIQRSKLAVHNMVAK